MMLFPSFKRISLSGTLLLSLLDLGTCRNAPRVVDGVSYLGLPLGGSHEPDLYTLFRPRDELASCVSLPLDPETPQCVLLCSPGTCGGSTTSRRSISFSEEDQTARGLNGSNEFSSLVPRAGLQTNGIQTQLTQTQLYSYIFNQFNRNLDNYFGSPMPLTFNEAGEDTDDTRFQLIQFGNQPFAIGSRYFEGCTCLTIISSTAVWMGHIWEVPSVSTTQQEWQERALNWITNTQPIFTGPYGTAVPFDPTQFTNDVRVYIMTVRKDPYKRGKTTVTPSYTSPAYSAKMNSLKTTIRGVLGQDVPIVQYNYVRSKKEQQTAGPLGKALFQYDPNANGQDKPGWRLFYQQNQFRDGSPISADMANGIPDQGQ